MVEVFEQAGVEIVHMNEEQFNQWLDVAKQSSYRQFAEDVPGGAELIEKALAVD